MGKLTFDAVMGFHDKHNRAVFQSIVEAQKKRILRPFVGAGLSCPFGYKLWGSVLKELAEYICADEEKEKALNEIQNCQYETAAQTILEAYPFMLDQLPRIVHPEILQTCSDETKRTSAAWLLPLLFREGLVITTNFDRVLEDVYLLQRNATIPTVTPVNQDKLDQLGQNQALGLLKLHGDIGSEAVSINELVFTGEQYAANYTDNSPLVKVLNNQFTNRRLLFLGCSLNVDRTMEVLKRVTNSQKSIRHYAILGCKKVDIPQRSKELASLGILPIFYDDSDHGAVRVILERLLEETDHTAYQALEEEKLRYIAPVQKDDVLMYNAGRINYVGRGDELAALQRFCGSPSKNEWWAVTGPGGIGKSRLVFEFTNKKRLEGWEIRWFSRDQYAQLTEFTPSTNCTLVVLDDVQADIHKVGDWLRSMRILHRSNKLRILLVERDGENYASADWLRYLRSGNPYTDPLAQWCHDPSFLHLKPLDDSNLKAIMTDYAEKTGKTVDANKLLKALVRVDRELRRPLYALAVAEAACSGEDPARWNSERVLDSMLDRELAFHYESLQCAIRETPTSSQQRELEELMAHCYIQGHLLPEAVTKERFPYLAACMERMSPTEFFRCLGLLQNEGNRTILQMNCPDLIREQLVLRLSLKQGRRKLLLPEGWQENSRHIAFLDQLLHNQAGCLEHENWLWDSVLKANPESPAACTAYAGLLWDVTAFCDTRRVQSATRLELLYQENQTNVFFQKAYAAGLFNLTIQQDLAGCTETVRKLTALSEQHPGSEEIAVALAMGLVNLSSKQDLTGRTETVSRLTMLSEQHPNSEEIAIELAKGLVNLSSEQDLAGCTETVRTLTGLSEQYPGSEEVAVELAKGLVNLSSKQDLTGRTETVRTLTVLSEQHSGNEEIAVALAKGLVNLSSKQDLAGRTETVSRLTVLSERYPGSKKIAAQLAGGLVNVAHSQTTEAAVRESLSRSSAVLQTYPDDPEIQLNYAMTWFNLTLVQKETDIPKTVAQISKFLAEHPAIIPEFREALDGYLSQHPDHRERYSCLLDIQG